MAGSTSSTPGAEMPAQPKPGIVPEGNSLPDPAAKDPRQVAGMPDPRFDGPDSSRPVPDPGIQTSDEAGAGG